MPREARETEPESRERGEASNAEREARALQNGDGRQGAKGDEHEVRAERPERDSEAARAPATELSPAPADIRVESDNKAETTPPRRGWWQR